MFTGLIQDIGTIVEATSYGEDGMGFVIRTRLAAEIRIDDSIATNGVCLTATHVTADTFSCRAIPVTLQKTNLGQLRPNDRVNLELSLRLHDRLGGHLVQGHVSDVGSILAITKSAETWLFDVSFPKALRKYMISEGSIAMEGISLTIAALAEDKLRVAIIPHTLQNTTLSGKKIGDSVNLEVDMLAKYIESFLQHSNDSSIAKWQQNFLT